MRDILLGRTESHLQLGFQNLKYQKEVDQAITRLAKRADVEGFQLRVLSSFRDFEKQKSIWTAKATGKKTLFDSDGIALDFETLSNDQIIEAILRWSAFPGASRHHWGTDIDVIDRKAVPEGYHVELIPEEVNGIFLPFFSWLDELINNDDAEGFYRPYDQDRGGVAPEAWHLSYRPIAKTLESHYTEDFFLEHLQSLNDLPLIDDVKKRGKEIYSRYVMNVSN